MPGTAAWDSIKSRIKRYPLILRVCDPNNNNIIITVYMYSVIIMFIQSRITCTDCLYITYRSYYYRYNNYIDLVATSTTVASGPLL